MRTTTFSPFQYQVQFKLTIQMSDNITAIVLLVVANLPIAILFSLGGGGVAHSAII